MSATLPVIKKSASALKLAAIICVVQALLAPLALVLILLGLKTDFVGLMLMSYFFTAYPAELLQWTGLPIRDGSFNLPTTIAFFSGLIIWFMCISFWRLHLLLSRANGMQRNPPPDLSSTCH